MFLMYLICGSVDIWYFLTIRATKTTDYVPQAHVSHLWLSRYQIIDHAQMVVFGTGKHLQTKSILHLI